MTRPQSPHRWRLGVWLLGLCGCTGLSESALLEGKPCTTSGACAAGYVCNTETLTCVKPPAAGASGGSAGAVGVAGQGPDGGGTAGEPFGGTGGAIADGGSAGGGTGGEGGARGCGDGILDADEECEPDGVAPCTERCTVDCASFAYGGTPLTLSDGSTHCYYALIMARSFDDSRLECEKHGGHLVTIHSSAEQSLVRSLVGAASTAWIGATDGLTVNDWMAGTYAWVTDEPFGFRPSGGFTSAPAPYCMGSCGHCATVSGSVADSWNVADCTGQLTGICEWSPPSP